jgi:energy-converting hydrogenase Eha subunit G
MFSESSENWKLTTSGKIGLCKFLYGFPNYFYWWENFINFVVVKGCARMLEKVSEKIEKFGYSHIFSPKAKQ